MKYFFGDTNILCVLWVYLGQQERKACLQELYHSTHFQDQRVILYWFLYHSTDTAVIH